jgi:hypothetical protein
VAHTLILASRNTNSGKQFEDPISKIPNIKNEKVPQIAKAILRKNKPGGIRLSDFNITKQQ